MILKNIKANQKDRGFTIVELLVVIVVIGILAAITIVSYTGITARANGSAAKANAQSIAKKVSIYQTDSTTSAWPVGFTAATSATTSSAAFSGATFLTGPATNSFAKDNIAYAHCGITRLTTGTSGSPAIAPSTIATGTDTAVTTITGIRLGYWDQSAQTMDIGQTTGTSTPPGSASTVVNTVGCVWTSNAAGTTP